jgi:hypothetical protein
MAGLAIGFTGLALSLLGERGLSPWLFWLGLGYTVGYCVYDCVR